MTNNITLNKKKPRSHIVARAPTHLQFLQIQRLVDIRRKRHHLFRHLYEVDLVAV